MRKSDNKFIVYCHTNNINGKRYIGITCQKPEKRFRNGKGYKSSKHFYSAIQKYGWENFSHEIIFYGLSHEMAKSKEIELISKYKTRDESYGYNLTPGGEGYCGKDNPWFGKHHTEEAKRKMSEMRKGIPKSDDCKRKISESNKGKIVSEKTKQKMRDNHADVSGRNNPCYGRKLSDEHIAKMVKASKTEKAISKMKENRSWLSGKDNPNSKRVICLETGIIYDTVNDAAKDNHCNPTKVSAVCHGSREHTKGLHFKLYNNTE